MTADGAVGVSRASGPQWLEPRFTPAERRALLRAVLQALRAPFDSEHPEASGLLGDHRVRVLGPPLIAGGPMLRLERRPGLVPECGTLVSAGLATQPMIELLTRGLGRGSILIVGAAGTGKSQLLGALAREAAASRRLLLFGVAPERFPAPLAARLCFAAEDAPLSLAPRAGAELVLAEEPSALGWLELLTGARPFVATLEAPDLTSALVRLAARLALERPGLGAEAAEALIESGLSVVAELGQRVGELQPQLLVLAEPRRAQGRLSVRVLGRRRPEGGEELALEGSRYSERIGSFGGRVSAPPAPAFVPDETQPERPEHLAMLSAGGLGVVEPGFAVEGAPPAGAPVGRVGARELSQLRPEQLVSQSFLVDVSKAPGFAPSTRIRTWAGEGDGTSDLDEGVSALGRSSTALADRAPSAVDALPEVAEVSFADGSLTQGEGASAGADVEAQDEFGGVKTLPPSAPPPGGRASLPLPKGLEGARVGQDDGRTLILGGGSATPSAAPGDVVDRRALAAQAKAGPKVRE